ncbi:MAG: transglycosylase SLT domain-containing protein, partial [Georgfuchsia sp.]
LLAAEKPKKYLAFLRKSYAGTRVGRELHMFAVARLASSDPRAAAERWETIKRPFSASERSYVYGQLGWQAAMDHLPEANAWFRRAKKTKLTDVQIEWKARAALRAQDWKSVRTIINGMPKSLAAMPAWVYWSGRAHAALGQGERAEKLYRRISGETSFYGKLADAELGITTNVPPPPAELTDAEIKATETDPGIRRALALFRLDMRIEGVREWNWALRGLDDRQLLAAAEVANQASIFDRAITAADRTVTEHDFSLRYPTPFLNHVEPKARELSLDRAWVYGLMRQESRFVMNAKSSAGASGLMQIMPRTAKWVARKLGLKSYHASRVNDMGMNVTLGTNYLKMVLENLDDNLVLASAAYNAGPGRARRWRDAGPLEGAIYIETIPFDETRDYVKKVMSNAVYYSALFEGQPQSLKTFIGVVPGRWRNEPPREYLP